MKSTKPIFFISCDQKYYEDWGYNLLQSLIFFNNLQNIILHCHVVNPSEKIQKINDVIYTFEDRNFLDRNREIAYLQCSRFLAVYKYYSRDEIVITLDADSICTREFSKKEIENLISYNHVLTRGKPNDNRWLAGMIVFKDSKFKKDYHDLILSKNDTQWEYGWDQIVLSQLAKNHNFKQLPNEWMSIGKNGLKRIFLTLKGISQKKEKKYLDNYFNLVKNIKKGNKMNLEKHLGGHNGLTHLDEGVLVWAMSNLNIKSMLDVGCGPGGMVELANNLGIDAHGVDGDYTLERYDDSKFTIHDFTNGPAPIDKLYDLTWSCKFVEHVYEEYIPNFATTMALSKYLIMTYAPIGHTGYHHVNCNTEEYWIKTMLKYGFVYDHNLTSEMRKHSTMGKKKKHRFVKNTGLLFRNEQR